MGYENWTARTRHGFHMPQHGDKREPTGLAAASANGLAVVDGAGMFSVDLALTAPTAPGSAPNLAQAGQTPHEKPSTTETWNGATADWNTPADWGGQVPGAISGTSADVLFNGTGKYTCATFQ